MEKIKERLMKEVSYIGRVVFLAGGNWSCGKEKHFLSKPRNMNQSIKVRKYKAC